MDLQLVGALIGILIHIPLIYGVINGSVKQNPVTYGLWAMLDIIAAYSTWKQDGNFLLSLFYAIGATIVCTALLIKHSIFWTKLETFVLMLVLVCLIIQYSLGDFYSMVASVIALTFASVPQFFDTYINPKNTPKMVYTFFTIAGLVSLLGANDFTLSQIIYPAFAFLNCFVILALSFKR